MNLKRLLDHIFLGVLMTAIITSCSSKSENQDNDYSPSSNNKRNYENNFSNFSLEEESNEDNEEYYSSTGCKFEEGTYSSTVDYYNPETGYRQTYTLDVEVEDCEVVQIYFNNGGWLDSDHITPAELDNDGTCTVYGEDGKTYEIQIEN